MDFLILNFCHLSQLEYITAAVNLSQLLTIDKTRNVFTPSEVYRGVKSLILSRQSLRHYLNVKQHNRTHIHT